MGGTIPSKRGEDFKKKMDFRDKHHREDKKRLEGVLSREIGPFLQTLARV